ncbi:hypothetical protein M2152_000405 [Microbacteriaceae bacterium SG_E_30_P1]|uniref:Glycosyl transferase family 2 n=1 Tax=Antiquaquibacter oligotrophicus TaxID=2880260 RepID=A0ABT6KJS6_9MICO|nr:hypothetical protein [Antiquaquibacter oligotrophicus]MDH6180223.1 hypothetical protein [Antiquaquibacter oligotrophicus]UDF14030.1 hypothetical protein LH407_04000 [Antiquaquibacter oligotrophicus]
MDDSLTGDSGSAPASRIGVVISTLGRAASLQHLLEDLAAQTRPPAIVIVCDQSTFADGSAAGELSVEAVCGRFAAVLPLERVTSQRGLSRGRNAGVAALAGRADYVFFPNDTSRVASDFFARFTPDENAQIVAGHYRDDAGVRRDFPAETVPVSKGNVWRVMEAAMLVRVDAVLAAGGFDEHLGSGADSPWQSGEGTDLLLRMSASGARVHFDPDLEVRGVRETDGLDGAARRRKLRAYGRGYGHILREWDFGARRAWAAVLGGLTLGVRQPGRFSVGDGLVVGLGRAEGVMNRLLGDARRTTAVDR